MTAQGVLTATGDHSLQRSRLSVRAPLFTASSVGLGLVAHAAAGGGPPGGAPVLGVVAAVALTSAFLVRRERSLPTIVLAVGLVQVGMHVVLPQHHEHMDPMAGGDSHAGMSSMLLTHTVAVLVLSWWLRRGEVAAWRVLGKVWRRLTRHQPVIGLSSERPTRPPVVAGHVRRSRALTRVVPVRGPPTCPA